MRILQNVDELFARFHIALQNDYPKQTLNKLSHFCRLLDEHESDLINDTITLSDILYSKYFYYTQLIKLYNEQYGANGSMEQERFKILEDMENRLEEAVDWERIESIEKLTYEFKV